MKHLLTALPTTLTILVCLCYPATAPADPISQFPDYDINNLELHVPADHPLGGPGMLVKCTTEQSKLKILVTKVLPVGPAHDAGIEAGDIITSINGADISNMSPKDAVNKLRGIAGTKITYTILRGNNKLSLPVDVSYVKSLNLANHIIAKLPKSKNIAEDLRDYEAIMRGTRTLQGWSIKEESADASLFNTLMDTKGENSALLLPSACRRCLYDILWAKTERKKTYSHVQGVHANLIQSDTQYSTNCKLVLDLTSNLPNTQLQELSKEQLITISEDLKSIAHVYAYRGMEANKARIEKQAITVAVFAYGKNSPELKKYIGELNHFDQDPNIKMLIRREEIIQETNQNPNNDTAIVCKSGFLNALSLGLTTLE